MTTPTEATYIIDKIIENIGGIKKQLDKLITTLITISVIGYLRNEKSDSIVYDSFFIKFEISADQFSYFVVVTLVVIFALIGSLVIDYVYNRNLLDIQWKQINALNPKKNNLFSQIPISANLYEYLYRLSTNDFKKSLTRLWYPSTLILLNIFFLSHILAINKLIVSRLDYTTKNVLVTLTIFTFLTLYFTFISSIKSISNKLGLILFLSLISILLFYYLLAILFYIPKEFQSINACFFIFLLGVALFFLLKRYLFNTIWYFPNSDKDYKKMSSSKIESSKKLQLFLEREATDMGSETKNELISLFEKNNLDAFVIADKQKILYEKYNDNYDAQTLISIWSLTKVFVGFLLQKAIEDKIKISLEDEIKIHIPEFKFGKIKIKHLLNMTSGLDYNQNKFVIWPYLKVHYSPNLAEIVRKIKIKSEPGLNFQYSQYDLIFLMLILRKVIGKSLTNYMSEKLWTPLNMTNDAFWLVDSTKNKHERAASGMFVCSEDLIKFAQLYLNEGTFDGKSIISKEYIETCLNSGAKDFKYMTNFWKHGFFVNEKYISVFDKSMILKAISAEDTFVNGANNNKILYLSQQKNLIIFASSSDLKNKNLVFQINDLK